MIPPRKHNIPKTEKSKKDSRIFLDRPSGNFTPCHSLLDLELQIESRYDVLLELIKSRTIKGPTVAEHQLVAIQSQHLRFSNILLVLKILADRPNLRWIGASLELKWVTRLSNDYFKQNLLKRLLLRLLNNNIDDFIDNNYYKYLVNYFDLKSQLLDSFWIESVPQRIFSPVFITKSNIDNEYTGWSRHHRTSTGMDQKSINKIQIIHDYYNQTQIRKIMERNSRIDHFVQEEYLQRKLEHIIPVYERPYYGNFLKDDIRITPWSSEATFVEKGGIE